MRISANDVLPVGTKVQVQNKRGSVVKAEIKRDQFGAPITVHTVKLTHQYSHTAGFANKAVYKELAKPKIQTVNYAFIDTL